MVNKFFSKNLAVVVLFESEFDMVCFLILTIVNLMIYRVVQWYIMSLIQNSFFIELSQNHAEGCLMPCGDKSIYLCNPLVLLNFAGILIVQ